MLSLVRPSVNYKQSFLEAVKEYSKEKDKHTLEFLDFHYGGLNIDKLQNYFEGFIEKLNERAEGKNLPEGFVPETVYWLVNDEEYIGKLSIRHYLNDNLLKIGGHIGYDIRPSERGKGYGKKILELGLVKAQDLGIADVLITCDETNTASRKIIEANGGALEDIIPNRDNPRKMRFWIKL